MSAGPFETAGDLIMFRDLFLDGEDDIGKGDAHGANDVLQAVELGTLPGEGNLLDYIFPDILGRRFNVSLCDHFGHKVPDYFSVVSSHFFPLNRRIKSIAVNGPGEY